MLWLVLGFLLVVAGLVAGYVVHLQALKEHGARARTAAPAAAADDPAAPPAVDDEPRETVRPEGSTGKVSTIADLAAAIAHEINNPLAIMMEEAGWILDLLVEPELEGNPHLPELRRAAEQIKVQGARCRDITHSLLSFARRSPGKIRDAQLGDLIHEAVRICERRAADAHVELATHVKDGLPTMRLSASELQQVIVNLVNNAIDAHGGDGGRVTVTMKGDAEALVVDVADTGKGIAKENLSRIFDPFFTTKDVGKGTGLGLAISRTIVEDLGGTIRVQSVVGQGTTFSVTIPVRQTKPKSAAESEELERTGETDLARSAELDGVKRGTVLIADDEVGLAEALSRRLERRGYTVLAAVSAAEALQALDTTRAIDVVLLDVRLAGDSGIELLRSIKARETMAEVILLSGHTTLEIAVEGLKLGASDFLVKPCDIGVLQAAIEKACRRRRTQEERIMEARIMEITTRRW